MGRFRLSPRLVGWVLWGALCSLGAGGSASALEISLDTSRLPSQQGWRFVSSAIPEADVFSVGVEEIVQDSLGVGVGFAAYRRAADINALDPLELQLDASLTGSRYPAGFGPGFYFAVFTGAERYSLVIEPGRVATLEGTNLGNLDTSVSHEYELVAVPGVSFSLFVDGELFAVGSGSPNGVAPQLEFGDGSFAQNSEGGIAHYRFYQGAEAPLVEVPAPAAGVLLLVGLGGLCGVGRRNPSA